MYKSTTQGQEQQRNTTPNTMYKYESMHVQIYISAATRINSSLYPLCNGEKMIEMIKWQEGE